MMSQVNLRARLSGSKMSFVHLHLHSQYSLLEATCRAKDIAKKAAEFKMPAVAQTDNGNMYGAMEFYFACKDQGVKPIIGLDVYLAPESRHIKTQNRDQIQKPNTRLVLLAQSQEGYRNLCQISSIGFHEGFYYKPRVDYEIIKKYSGDIIALSGHLRGEVPFEFLEKGKESSLEKLRQLKEIYQDRFYLEMCRTGDAKWNEVNEFLLEASKITDTPVVATNNVHYMQQDEQLAQEVLICIGTNKTLQDESRLRLGSDQFYFKSPEQMRSLFQDHAEACDRTLEVAERCQIDFKLKDDDGKPIYFLPTYPTEAGRSLKEEIKSVSLKGLELRHQESLDRGETVTDKDREVYLKRLDYELGVIDRMGFNGYFLIVQDFIKWAKEKNIPVGPGRGSGAGSLVAYCLYITDLDPMPISLIFERFLNPERISMPDFDIDFCQERRQEVIEYVTQKYGAESVSQIITYGKLQTKAAIRDVGRVLGMLYSEVDVISKLVPDKLGISLQEAIDLEPRLKELMDSDPQVNTLMELARKVEGLVRHAGIHAAGVIIADGQLVRHAPLSKGADGEQVVQYDMKHAEKIGLIKFDFLGLKTLTHINYALQFIGKNRGKKIRTQDIGLEDPGIYELLSSGDTAGIFQFEGDGITDATRKIKPSCFADIVAITSLYRPGPMEMIPEYTKRKHGESKIEYLFPELEEILSETYGIIIYQEHVQLIAAKIASYSLGEADMLRRAMGKKIAEEMAKQKTRFMSGAKDNGFDEKKAGELFGLMEEFAKYGFNKSHAAAYCVITAQTAWLKRYYPTEFFAALMSTEMSDTDKVVKYIKDAQAHKIKVNSPHVNHSDYKFTVRGSEIFYGLGAIKGVGQSAVEAIIEAREELPEKKFESLEGFFEAIDLRRVNKKVIECLIKAGAFDDFGFNRETLMNGYVRYLDRAETQRRDSEMGQASLFDLGDGDENKVVLEKAPGWTRSARLAYEKEVIGFYLSDHPLKGLERLLQVFTSSEIGRLGEREHKSEVKIAGLLSSFKEFVTKKGTRMAFAALEDLSGQVELIVFPQVYQQVEEILKEDGVLVVSGRLENENDGQKIMVDDVKLLSRELQSAKSLVIYLDPSMEGDFLRLKEIIHKFPGDTAVNFELSLPDLNKRVVFSPTEGKGIGTSDEFFEGIHSLFGRMDFVELRM